VSRWLQTADFSTLKMEAMLSSKTSVHTSSTRSYIPADSILHSHSRENLKSYRLCKLFSNCCVFRHKEQSFLNESVVYKETMSPPDSFVDLEHIYRKTKFSSE
jgi:hypothetical protein